MKSIYVWAWIEPIGGEPFCCSAIVDVENEDEALAALSVLRGFDVEEVSDKGFVTQGDFASYKKWNPVTKIAKLALPTFDGGMETGTRLWVTFEDVNGSRHVTVAYYCFEDAYEKTGSGFLTDTATPEDFNQVDRRVIAWKEAGNEVTPPDMYTGPA